MNPPAPRSRNDRIFSRREIEGLIADGRHIIILDGMVLKVDAWIPFHPGGYTAIKHMVGRDATDEVTAYVFLYPPPMHIFTIINIIGLKLTLL